MQLRRVFETHSISWDRIVTIAATVSWADWENGRMETTPITSAIQNNANRFVAISEELSIGLDSIVRNAVAIAPIKELQIAALAVAQLLMEKKLKGDPKNWREIFPKPTPFEYFLLKFIDGQFVPKPTVFRELLKAAYETDAETNCILNLLLSSDDFPATSSVLFSTLKRYPEIKKIDTRRLFLSLESMINITDLIGDIQLIQFRKLPKTWQIFILHHPDRTNFYLSDELVQQLTKDPFLTPNTKQALKESSLRQELISDLKSHKLHISQKLVVAIRSDGFFTRMDQVLDWSYLKNLHVTALQNHAEASLKADFWFLSKGLPAQSAANIALLYLVGKSHEQPFLEPKDSPENLDAFIKSATPEAIIFAVRNARGWMQKKLVEILQEFYLGTLSINTISRIIISGKIDASTDPSILILALKNIKDTKRRYCFSKLIANPDIAFALLEKFDEFRTYYSSQLKRANFPSYCISDEAFRIYGGLGSWGGEIIELILARVNKLSPKIRVSEILQKTVSHAPGAALGVFQRRGILSDKFVDLISNPKFFKLSDYDQRLILELKTPSGRSAFRDALNKKRLAVELMRDLEQNKNVLDFLVRYDPTILKHRKTTVTERLAASVYNLSDAKNLPKQFSQSELIKALPGAMNLLETRSRAAAALELAVLSNLSVLPIFLQLVGKLAPPYKNEDLGRRYDAFYTTYNLPKKSGGNRLISAPAPHLKLAQRALLPLIYAEDLSDFALGFRPGKSIKDNALPHVGKEIVVNADIRGFFPSTTYKMIYSVSRRIRSGSLSPLAARLFSEICSHNGHLATGAPTSPAVSNILLKPLDDSLAKIAQKLNISYSRYADDITFSGGSAAVWMLKPLEKNLAKMGYELDPKKTNIFRKGRRQTVTGAVVNQKISLARPLRKKLRAAVHNRLNGRQPTMHGQPLSDQALKGYLSYLLMLAPEHANPLLEKLRDSKKWPH
jgi:RNA-directed DNA polymerase